METTTTGQSQLSVANRRRHAICLMTIYLGNLPGWLAVWLRSCELNPHFDFLLLTDRPEDVTYRPRNVRIESITLLELKDRFSTAVGFEVTLNHSYKICDFKPVFGAAFPDLLKSYDFWAHTDVDMFYGSLESFIPDAALNQCVRLYHRGHLSLFRNDPEGNQLYRLPHPDISWRSTFRTDEYCHFDEYKGIEKLISYNKVPEFEDNYAFADILPRYPDLRLTRMELNHRHQIFVYDHGRVFQLFLHNKELLRREFMYLHLQKRPMPAIDPNQWKTHFNWICTPQGFLVADLTRIGETELRKYNRPNYPHALKYALKRAARRLDWTGSRKSS